MFRHVTCPRTAGGAGTNRELTRTTIAFVVALVMCAPVAMAQSDTRHSHVTHYPTSHSYITTQQWLPAFGYASTVPLYGLNWGWECVTDVGQGRFLPCDVGS
jgi:hypothetical protein